MQKTTEQSKFASPSNLWFSHCGSRLRPRGRRSKGINHRVKQGRLLRFINGNDLSICWSQFTRVSWAQHTMGQPTYELPAPLRWVHKTTGIAAGEHPETPPSCTDHQMTQMGRNQTKTRPPFVQRGTPFKSHSCNKLGKSGHATLWVCSFISVGLTSQ